MTSSRWSFGVLDDARRDRVEVERDGELGDLLCGRHTAHSVSVPGNSGCASGALRR